MGKDKLLQIRETLMQGGVAYRHVKRLLGELKDHHEDLRLEAMRHGADEQQARLQADARLGDPQLLVDEMLQRPELKSLGYRYPKTLMVLFPFLLQVILVVVLVILMILIGTSINSEFPGFDQGSGIREFPAFVVLLFKSLSFGIMYLIPVLIGVMLAAYAARNQIALRYYGLGLLLTWILGCSLYMTIIWPDIASGEQGALRLSISLINWDFQPDYPVRLVICFVMAWVSRIYILHKIQHDPVRCG